MRIDPSTTAVVTGGASGLGLATVKALRSSGMKVAILDLDPAAGASAEAETGATFHQVDVTSEESLDTAISQARAAQGPEHGLVCRAGGGQAGDRTRSDDGGDPPLSHRRFREDIGIERHRRLCRYHAYRGRAAELNPWDDERGVIVCTSSV